MIEAAQRSEESFHSPFPLFAPVRRFAGNIRQDPGENTSF